MKNQDGGEICSKPSTSYSRLNIIGMFHGLHDLSIQQSTALKSDFRSGVLQPAEDMLQRAKNK